MGRTGGERQCMGAEEHSDRLAVHGVSGGQSHECGVAGANLESVADKDSCLAGRKSSHERQDFRGNRLRNVAIQSTRYVATEYEQQHHTV
jgi:hypothetical protein